MSFFHAVYVGHFEQDADGVRFARDAGDKTLKPVISGQLDLDLVGQLAGVYTNPGSHHGMVPTGWQIWSEAGYLLCDRYALSQDAVEFLRSLVKATGCLVVDFNARSSIPVENLVASVPPTAAGKKEDIASIDNCQ